jgi:hypothetical protein
MRRGGRSSACGPLLAYQPLLHVRLRNLGLLACLAVGLTAAQPVGTAGHGASGDRVGLPSGGARDVGIADFSPHEATTTTFSEVWSYFFLLDGGMQASFNISRANLGRLMGSVTGSEFTVTNFGGRSYRAAKEYAAEDLVFARETQRLQVHPDVFVEGALPRRHQIRFHAGKHGLDYEVDLTLTDIASGFTWGDGVFRLGSHRIGMYVHIPYARVSGTITIGGTTRRVSGTAYMDHTYQTDFAPRLVRSTFRYIQHGSTPEVGYFILPASRYEDRVVGFGGRREGGRFTLQRPAGVEVISTRPAQGVEVPNQLAVRFEGGAQTILNRTRDAQAFSVLEELSNIQRGVVRRFVGGEALVFRGEGTTNLREPVAYDYVIIR